MTNIETKDKELFNLIAKKYAKKDTYTPSSMARQFQIDTLINLLKEHFDLDNVINVLDIGCGHGATAKYLKPFYNTYVGLDYSDELINIARFKYGDEKTKFVCENIKDFKQYNEYNVVIGIGVLHHVTELVDTLIWLKKSCPEGTIFAFNEPLKSNPVIGTLRKIRKKIDKNYSEDQTFFTKKELRDIFEKAGFEVKTIKSLGYFSVPFAQVILKPASIFKILSRLSIWIDKKIQKRINSKFAWNMIILAK